MVMFYIRQALYWISFVTLSVLVLGVEIGGAVSFIIAGISLSIMIPLIWFWKGSIDHWVKIKKDYEFKMSQYEVETQNK